MAFQYRNRIRIKSRKLSEETKSRISKANKGKRSGSVPWNKGKKLHYITGKREHSDQTREKMNIAAKLRWSGLDPKDEQNVINNC
jgi:NUMOD3 motif